MHMHFRAHSSLHSKLLLAFLSLPALLLTQVALGQTLVNRIELKGEKPLWISSAAYIESLKKIGLVDPLQNSLILVDAGGDGRVYDQSQLVDTPSEMVPATIHRTVDGYVLAMVNQRLYRLDQNLERVGVEPGAKESAAGKVLSIYESAVAGPSFLSVGAVKPAGGKTRYGFFQAPIQDPASFQFLQDVAEINYYLLGHKYLCGTADGKEYALQMGGTTAEVVEFRDKAKPRTLEGVVPAGYRAIPALKTQLSGPGAEKALFQEIEGLSIPVGLYAQGDLLYLLTREPIRGSEGRTAWRLHQINPKTNKVLGSLTLPTGADAHHLTVVNTSRDWYIFEKGAVDKQGAQKISSMLVIPAAQIQKLCLTKNCRVSSK